MAMGLTEHKILQAQSIGLIFIYVLLGNLPKLQLWIQFWIF